MDDAKWFALSFIAHGGSVREAAAWSGLQVSTIRRWLPSSRYGAMGEAGAARRALRVMNVAPLDQCALLERMRRELSERESAAGPGEALPL